MIKVIQNIAAEDSRQQYGTPKINVIFVKAYDVLCLSGNEPMREDDYGDAGFSEV